MLFFIILLYSIIGISFGFVDAIESVAVRSSDIHVWGYRYPISYYYKYNILGLLKNVITWDKVNFVGKLIPFLLLLPMSPFFFVSYSITFVLFLFPELYKWIFRVREK